MDEPDLHYFGSYESLKDQKPRRSIVSQTSASTSLASSVVAQDDDRMLMAKTILQDLVMHPDESLVSAKALLSAERALRGSDSKRYQGLDEWPAESLRRRGLDDSELDMLLHRDRSLPTDKQLGLVPRRIKMLGQSKRKGRESAKVRVPSVAEKPTICTVVRILQTKKPERTPIPEKSQTITFGPESGLRGDSKQSESKNERSSPLKDQNGKRIVKIKKTELSHLRHTIRHSMRVERMLQRDITPSSFTSDQQDNYDSPDPGEKAEKPNRTPLVLPSLVRNSRHRQHLVDELISKPLSSSLSAHQITSARNNNPAPVEDCIVDDSSKNQVNEEESIPQDHQS